MHAFRSRFGIPGVISIIALVFAMFGGAYAASNDGGKASVSAKAKKGPRGPRGPRGPAGLAGPAGPAGETGAPGAKGAQGAQGAKGADGAQGAAGAKGATGAAGAAGATGPEGSPWTAGGTLPSGETETGMWSLGPTYESELGVFQANTALSFPLPLSSAPTPHYISGAPTAECPGNFESPQAAPGQLCLYQFQALNVSSLIIISKKSGAIPIFSVEDELAVGFGSFAVTAP